jgi:hypothetical protein
MNRANVGPIVDGASVDGACRPGHLGADLSAWVGSLTARDVTTVVCLLSETEASRWQLPARYADTFATAHVPIRDRHLPSVDTLERALAVLDEATADGGRAALHCNAGLGRTGVVAAAWLVHDRGADPLAAVEAVESSRVPRAPREAIRDGNATEADLRRLLATVGTGD